MDEDGDSHNGRGPRGKRRRLLPRVGGAQLTVAGREATEGRGRGCRDSPILVHRAAVVGRRWRMAVGARGGDGQAHRFMTTAVGAAQLAVAGREERESRGRGCGCVHHRNENVPPTHKPGTRVRMLLQCCQMSPNRFTSGTCAPHSRITVSSAGTKFFFGLLDGTPAAERGRERQGSWRAAVEDAWKERRSGGRGLWFAQPTVAGRASDGGMAKAAGDSHD